MSKGHNAAFYRCIMSTCNLCPRKCGVDRSESKGYCGAGETLRIARASLHFWEEPCVSGTRGSGTVFFTGCSLRCDFCQNNAISHKDGGKDITAARFYEILFELKDKGAHNINLVTADHYLDKLIPIVKTAKKDGLDIPVFVNTSSYITTALVKNLGGAVDGFIADLKFTNSDIAQKYCNAADYPSVAKAAIDSMLTLVGDPRYSDDSTLNSGVIVRIPVLPSNLIDAKRCIKYVRDLYGERVILSVMSQYTPMPTCPHPELSRPLSELEYMSIKKYVSALGISGYIQEYGADGERFIPEFNCEGV